MNRVTVSSTSKAEPLTRLLVSRTRYWDGTAVLLVEPERRRARTTGNLRLGAAAWSDPGIRFANVGTSPAVNSLDSSTCSQAGSAFACQSLVEDRSRLPLALWREMQRSRLRFSIRYCGENCSRRRPQKHSERRGSALRVVSLPGSAAAFRCCPGAAMLAPEW